jgi:hypothetical protein
MALIEGIGKYNIGIDALIASKVIKSSVKKVSQLSNKNNWIQSKCSSLDAFLSNSALQEQIMTELTLRNYNLLVANGVINEKNMNLASEVSAWIAVAHGLGVTGAFDYASGNSNDTQLAAVLFQQGKWADMFAKDVPTILAG